jgi:hypothetical protein
LQFALELEHERERMLEDGLGFDTIDALIDEQIVQYLARRNEHLAELRGLSGSARPAPPSLKSKELNAEAAQAHHAAG